MRVINSICREREYFYTAGFVPSPDWSLALYTPEQAVSHLLLAGRLSEGVIAFANVFSQSSDREDGCVFGIGVLAPYRNQGVGTLLLATALEWSSAQGYGSINLSVRVTNAPAIHLYEKFGFRTEQCQKREYALLGEQEEFVMSRMLR